MKKLSFEINDKKIDIYEKGSDYPAASVDYDDVDHAKAEQLARLFCAAPDLLEALQELLVWADWHSDRHRSVSMDEPHTGAQEKARAAIAKATGEGGVIGATHEDPVVGKFLTFLAKDIAQRAEALKPLSADFAARMESLVKGTKVDLDEPIDGDVDL